MERLRSLHYINDEAFARSWTLTQGNRGYGIKRIEQELKAKGVGQSVIREAVRETLHQTNETESATKLLEKKYQGKNLSDPKILRRAAAFLQRRGYSGQIIFDLLHFSVEDD